MGKSGKYHGISMIGAAPLPKMPNICIRVFFLTLCELIYMVNPHLWLLTAENGKIQF